MECSFLKLIMKYFEVLSPYVPFIAVQFFTTKPYACEPSILPKYPPSKEMDAKRRDEDARRSSYLDSFFYFFNHTSHSCFHIEVYDYFVAYQKKVL